MIYQNIHVVNIFQNEVNELEKKIIRNQRLSFIGEYVLKF